MHTSAHSLLQNKHFHLCFCYIWEIEKYIHNGLVYCKFQSTKFMWIICGTLFSNSSYAQLWLPRSILQESCETSCTNSKVRYIMYCACLMSSLYRTVIKTTQNTQFGWPIKIGWTWLYLSPSKESSNLTLRDLASLRHGTEPPRVLLTVLWACAVIMLFDFRTFLL